MVAVRAPRATYADIEALPEGVTGEILDGELHVHPRPASPHTRAASKLGGLLVTPFFRGGPHGPGGWVLLDQPELHFGDDVLVPDLAGWRRARMPEEPESAFIELAPDWACEILSPSTRRVDLVKKRPIYAREGVGHLWLVDPSEQLIEVFRLESGRWSLISSTSGPTPVALEPFEAIELDTAFLWSR
jgi:Uma2 family endonuclease